MSEESKLGQTVTVSNPNGTHVPVMLVIPNGARVTLQKSANVEWPGATCGPRPTTFLLQDGPLAGKTVVAVDPETVVK